MEELANIICLQMFHLRSDVVNEIDGEKELVVMLIRSTTELSPVICHDSKNRKLVLLSEWQKLIIN